jgi:hypothetical protein
VRGIRSTVAKAARAAISNASRASCWSISVWQALRRIRMRRILTQMPSPASIFSRPGGITPAIADSRAMECRTRSAHRDRAGRCWRDRFPVSCLRQSPNRAQSEDRSGSAYITGKEGLTAASTLERNNECVAARLNDALAPPVIVI